MDFGRNAWCIAGVPVDARGRGKVFPDLGEPRGRLPPVGCHPRRPPAPTARIRRGAWETHNAAFEKNKRFLNEQPRSIALRYRSSNGTDLTVGMNKGHIWEGGAARTVDGTVFFPNIPTEEVFTSPDRMRADGIVYSALPLVHAGQVVRDFWFRFEGGAVVEYGAAQGKEVLRQHP